MIISVTFSIKVRWGQIDVFVHLYNNEMSYKMKPSIKYAKRFVLSVSCIYYYINEMYTEQLTKET
jgi:vacuolar-type H+-ATPase subunit C/Vma6